MVVPMWIEFIAARNGTSEAGSSSPVLEKCSNSSAKQRKRCRSSRPRGSMSVDSIFLMTGIGKGKTWVGKDLEATLAACRPWDEPGLKNFANLPRLGRE